MLPVSVVPPKRIYSHILPLSPLSALLLDETHHPAEEKEPIHLGFITVRYPTSEHFLVMLCDMPA